MSTTQLYPLHGLIVIPLSQCSGLVLYYVVLYIILYIPLSTFDDRPLTTLGFYSTDVYPLGYVAAPLSSSYIATEVSLLQEEVKGGMASFILRTVHVFLRISRGAGP